LEDDMRSFVRKVEELQAANARLQLLHGGSDAAAEMQRLEDELKDLRLKKREVEAQFREAEERGELLNSTLRDKERRFREKEQGYITKANEVDNEMRQLRARTAEACMELEELQDEVALLERKLADSEDLRHEAVRELQQQMEINTDLQSKEQILEKLSEDMNDAATKWKEEVVARSQDYESQILELSQNLELSLEQLKQRDQAIEKLEQLLGHKEGDMHSHVDGAMEEVHSEKIHTLEKYNDVLCLELERKKEEAKDANKKLQELDKEFRRLTKDLEKKEGAVRELGIRIETAELKRTDAETRVAAQDSELEQRENEIQELRSEKRRLELEVREAASKEQVANEEVVEQMNAAKMAQEMAEKGRESEAEMMHNMEANIRQLERENELQSRQLRAANTSVQELTQELERKTADLEELQRRRREEVEARLAQVDSTMQSGLTEAERLKEQVLTLQDEKIELSLNCRRAEEQVGLLQDQLKQSKQDSDELWGRMQESDSVLQDRDSHIRTLTARLEGKSEELVAAEERLKFAEERSEKWSKKAEHSAMELSALKKSHMAAVSEKETLQSEIEIMSNHSDVISEADLEAREEEIDHLKSKIAELEDTIYALRSEVQEKHRAGQKALQEAHNKDIEALEVKMGAEKLTWENAALQKKLDTCSEQLQEATASQKALLDEAEILRMENAALGTEQEILTQTITRLEGERAAKHQESEEKHQRQMQALKDRFAEREKELKDESQALEDLQTQRVAELVAVRQGLMEDAEKWKKESKRLQKDLQEKEWAHEDAKRESDRLQKDLATANERRKQVEERLRSVEVQLGNGRKQVSSLELEIRQLKDRLADEEEARESAETRQDGLRKNAAEKASALELERQKAAHELDVKDTQIVDLQSRLGQVEREAEVLRKGVEDKERRLASLVEGDGSHSRALVAQVEMRVREQEANQLQKYDQELALMQRRVITLQETVKALEDQLSESQSKQREAEAARQAAELGMERKDTLVRDMESRLADAESDLQVATERSEKDREKCRAVEDERNRLMFQLKEDRGRLEKAKEEASLEIDTRLEQRDRDLQQLQDQLAECEGEIESLLEKKREAEVQALEVQQLLEEVRDEAGTSGTALAQAHKDLKQKEGELADVKRALAHLRDSQLPEEKGQRQALTDEVQSLAHECASLKEELAAQVQKADDKDKEARKVAQQITVAERELTQKRMDMELLKTQVENLQEEKQSGSQMFEEQIAQMKTRMKAIEDDRAELEAREAKLKEELEGRAPVTPQSTDDDANVELDEARATLRRKEVQVSTLQSQLREAKADADARKAELEAFKTQAKTKSAGLHETTARVQELEAALRELETSSEERRVKLEKATQQAIQEMEAALKETEQRLKDVNAQRQRAVTEADELRQELRQSRQLTARREINEVVEVEELTMLRRKVRELEDTTGNVKQLKEEIQALREEMIDKEERIRTLRAEKARLSDEAGEAEAQAMELQRSLRVAETELKELREEMQKKNLEVRKMTRALAEKDRQLEASKREGYTAHRAAGMLVTKSAGDMKADSTTINKMERQLSLFKQKDESPSNSASVLMEKMQAWKREDEERRRNRKTTSPSVSTAFERGGVGSTLRSASARSTVGVDAGVRTPYVRASGLTSLRSGSHSPSGSSGSGGVTPSRQLSTDDLVDEEGSPPLQIGPPSTASSES